MLPVTFGQDGTGLAPFTGGGGLDVAAMRDLRVGLTYALIPRPRAPIGSPRASTFAMTGRLEMSLPTGEATQFAGERTAVFIPSLAADLAAGRFFFGAEAGVRARPVTELLGARIGPQGIFALGAGVDLFARHEALSFTAEARAMPFFSEQNTVSVTPAGLESQPNGTYAVPAEWAASLRTATRSGLAFQLGGGGPIPFTSDAPTTPRFRFTLSVRYAPINPDTDGDGVLNREDECPAEAGPKSNQGCPTGVPSGPAPARRREGLGKAARLHLDEVKEVCTSEPDMVDGFRSDDGCPDEDADHDGVPNRYDRCPDQPEDNRGPRDGCPEKHP